MIKRIFLVLLSFVLMAGGCDEDPYKEIDEKQQDLYIEQDKLEFKQTRIERLTKIHYPFDGVLLKDEHKNVYVIQADLPENLDGTTTWTEHEHTYKIHFIKHNDLEALGTKLVQADSLLINLVKDTSE